MERGHVMPANRLRVLCIDDNRDVADSEAMMLDLHGYDARDCYSGTAAVLEAEEFDPHVCLVDLDMPGMDGCEVAATLRGPGTGLPVMVAVTARGGVAERRRTAEAGFAAHLVKPVEPAVLFATIGRLTGA